MMQASQPTAWLWIASCTTDNERCVRSLSLLSESERNRYTRIHSEGRQRQFLHGRLLLREMLAHRFEQDVENWPIVECSGQAPRLVRETPSPICFSISHSHYRVACLVADGVRAGCDIEFMKKMRDFRAIVAAYFDAKVANELDALPLNQQRDFFYRLWTQHEAAFKASGTGIHLATTVDDEYCIAIALDRPHPVVVCHTSSHTDPTPKTRLLNWQSIEPMIATTNLGKH